MKTDNNNFKTISELEDLQIGENIDIDAIQANLQQHMAKENVQYDVEPSKIEETVSEEYTSETEDLAAFSEMLEANSGAPQEKTSEEIKAEEKEEIEFDDNVEQTFYNNLSENKHITKTETPKQLTEGKLKLQPGEKKYVVYIEPDNVDFIEQLTVKERKRVINRAIKYEDESVRKKKERREKAKFTKQVIIMVVTVICSLPFFFMLLNKSIELTIVNYQQAQQNFVKLYKEQGKIKSYKNFQKNFD